jgi:hypothetical protein
MIDDDTAWNSIEIMKAITMPEAHQIALEVFDFLMSYKEQCTNYVQGMDLVPQGLNIEKLDYLMEKKLNKDIFEYEFAVNFLEDKIVEEYKNRNQGSQP